MRARIAPSRWLAPLALAALLCSAPGSPEADVDAAGTVRWNVLLVTVDCLRPDHLSLYGYDRQTSPHLDAFAREAVVFENAFATSAWTSPGIVSMLTGYYPAVHAQNGRYSFYDDELASPLRVLAENGYETFGRSATGATYAQLGLEHEVGGVGLDAFVDGRASAPEPFFAWLHLREPHLPYRPSAEHAGRWSDPGTTSPGVAAVREHKVVFRDPDVEVGFAHAGPVTFAPEDAAEVRALYDETVLDADAHLGRAFARLRETGLLERTIVIVSADHGEELLEHGWVGHASTSYDGKLTDELIRIPLVIRHPAGAWRGRVDALVQGVDLMPTLLDALGLPADGLVPPMQGHSLLPLLEGAGRPVRQHVYAETTRKGWTTPEAEMRARVVAVRSVDRKLVWLPAEGGRPARIEAYDLVADPQETHDLWGREPGRFADLQDARAAWDAANERAAADLVLPAARRHLASLERYLDAGRLLPAVFHWRRIAMLGRTWGYERRPFFEGEAGPAWRVLRLSAARDVATAMTCDARDGSWERGDDGLLHCRTD